MELNEININISGTIFSLDDSILELFPNSYFENSQARIRRINGTDVKEFYFNGNAECFRAILWYHTNGELHMPTSLCPQIFRRELQFWNIEPSKMSRCCYMRYVSFFEDQSLLISFARKESEPVKRSIEQSEPLNSNWRKFRKKWWEVLNHQTSSKTAKIYTLVSTLVILTSIFVLSASTHPSFQRELQLHEWKEYYKDNVGMLAKIEKEDQRRQIVKMRKKIKEIDIKIEKCRKPKSKKHEKRCSKKKMEALSKDKIKYQGITHALKLKTNVSQVIKDLMNESCTHCKDNSSDNPVIHLPTGSTVARYYYLDIIDYIVFSYFLIEFLLRFILCPKRSKFFCDKINIIDTVALVSEAITMICGYIFPKEKYTTFSLLDVIECLQFFRVFRLFRIAHNFSEFRALIYSIKATLPNMLINLFLLLTAALIFSTLQFYCDRERFPSIPDALWWAVVTMTTVGYGDMYPKTLLGKLVGCTCAVSGIFVLAVLIPVFVQNFIIVSDFARINAYSEPKTRKISTTKLP